MNTDQPAEVAAAAPPVEIKVRDNGPYKVTGPVRLVDADGAVFDVLKVPMGGTGDGFFWADELFVSTADSEAALSAVAFATVGKLSNMPQVRVLFAADRACAWKGMRGS